MYNTEFIFALPSVNIFVCNRRLFLSHNTEGTGRYFFSSCCSSFTSFQVISLLSEYINGSIDKWSLSTSTIPSSFIRASLLSPLTPHIVQYEASLFKYLG